MADLVRLIQERKRKEANRPDELTEEQKVENLKHWTTFYRRNMNLYIQDRLGVRLDPDQHLMVYLISQSMTYVGIAGRGAGKSFILALVACAYGLLYPNAEITLVASTIPQGMVIWNKIQRELCGGSNKQGLSPLLSYLYQHDQIIFRFSDRGLEIEFKTTGTIIKVLPPLDTSRGQRSCFTIYDEFRLLKKADVDSIFEPMIQHRKADYLNLPEYKGRTDIIDEGKSAFISSAFWKNEWAWRHCKEVVTKMLNNDKLTPNNLFAEDAYVPMKYSRLTYAQYTKLKSTMSDLTFRIEMLNEAVGEIENSYFTLDEIKANQILKQGFRRPTIQEFISHKDIGNRRKKDNETRILFIDFAFEASVRNDANDNTVIGLLSCFWDGEKLVRNVDYIMTLEGGGDPVKVIREMYYDFDVDYIVYDSRNGGTVYANEMTQPYIHPERGIEYRGFTSCNNPDLQVANIAKVEALANSAIDPQAIPCLIPITATEEFNSEVWMALKLALQRGNLRLLISESEFDISVEGDKKWAKMESNERMRVKLPHVNTDLLVNEMINLEPIYSGGKVKLKEPRSGFKDRAVALGYGNYIATLLENKLQREHNDIDYSISEWTLVV